MDTVYREKKIYLDHAATTPVKPQALTAMLPYLETGYGNPGGIYTVAVDAKRAVNQARRTIAKWIGADSSEIFFTSGGSESDNWVIKGVYFAAVLKQSNICLEDKMRKPHIITTAFEHHAILESCAFLERLGAKVTYLEPNKEGFVSTEQLEKEICPETILVSVMFANNEIGTIQPIKELAEVAHRHGVLFHTDAVQAMGHIPVMVNELQVDFLSASGHKFGAPKGVGFLYAKQGSAIENLLSGGGQERGHRAGTENVASIVAMATAAMIPEKEEKIRAMRDYLYEHICAEISDIELHGAQEKRLAGNLNFSIAGVQSEALLLELNHYGVCVSGGAACTTSSKDGSHVIRAIGKSEEAARSAIRITIGEENTMEEMDRTVYALKAAVEKLRALRLLQQS